MFDSGLESCREQLIESTLNLCLSQGYDETTVDQIARAAGVTSADFDWHFATKEAVLMLVVDDMSRATAAALGDVAKDVEPQHALLKASTAAMRAVVEGRGAVPLERLIAMARIVAETPRMQRKVSVARKRVIARPLADWMGVDTQDQRLKRALTMWSAVVASAYVCAVGMPENYDPVRDDSLPERMIGDLSQSFADVTGQDPTR
jgi:AcrR family transcriptional regulator